ncbi:MAG TPA: response regulator [Gemmatimonadaceae bacterium]|jgi:two-component system cell cycle response regulator DivK
MPTILIVEDNETNMQLSSFLLETANYAVLKARTAEVGVVLARAQHPDLILMDIQLPGMDGLQATALLKADEATRSIPVLALTALAMKGDEERIRAAGCDGYIAKPLDYKSFLAEVKSRLAGGPISTTDAL